jgi:DNA transposition AAA+ family ATPase
MGERIGRATRRVGFHIRRQAVGYVALAVALGGTAYAGGKASSGKVGAKDLKQFVLRDGNAVIISPNDAAQSTARCKRRERALAPIGDGSFQDGTGTALNSISALGVGNHQGFVVSAFNTSPQPQSLQSRVLCLKR